LNPLQAKSQILSHHLQSSFEEIGHQHDFEEFLSEDDDMADFSMMKDCKPFKDAVIEPV
jgi:hypothetical protein